MPVEVVQCPLGDAQLRSQHSALLCRSRNDAASRERAVLWCVERYNAEIATFQIDEVAERILRSSLLPSRGPCLCYFENWQ